MAAGVTPGWEMASNRTRAEWGGWSSQQGGEGAAGQQRIDDDAKERGSAAGPNSLELLHSH